MSTSSLVQTVLASLAAASSGTDISTAAAMTS